MEQILDVREMVPRERHPRIFDTFKSLGLGEYFVLVNDHDPKPLLYQFQNEHDGEFDWWPLEQGPQVWRVAIAKRKVKDPNRTITEYFQSDHRRLDGIMDRFQDAYKTGRWEEASRDFREFNLGLRRHIQVEEEVLFPAFEEKTGMHDAGPTFVMRMEHTEIRGLLDRTLGATDSKNGSQIAESTHALTNILGDHNMKEEHILYPESDGIFSDHERIQVVKKAQTL